MASKSKAFPKLFAQNIDGISKPVPIQFFIPEEFEEKERLLLQIKNNGGVVVEKITSLTYQISHIKDPDNDTSINKNFYNGLIFSTKLISDSVKLEKFQNPFSYRLYRVNYSSKQLPDRYGEYYRFDEIVRIMIEIPAKPGVQYHNRYISRALNWLYGRTKHSLEYFISTYCQSPNKADWIENIIKKRNIKTDIIEYKVLFPFAEEAEFEITSFQDEETRHESKVKDRDQNIINTQWDLSEDEKIEELKEEDDYFDQKYTITSSELREINEAIISDSDKVIKLN